jgi:hypothetical protein
MQHFRHFTGFWRISCLLAVAFGLRGWAYPEQVAALPLSSLAASLDLSLEEAQLNPYQRWQQQHAPSAVPSAGSSFYRLAQQAEQEAPKLPFPLKAEGIPLGQDSSFFLHPSGLVYRLSY